MLTTITSPNGNVVLTNAYYPAPGGAGSVSGRVETQTLAATGATAPTYSFSYETDANNNIYEAQVTDPLGNERVVDFSTGAVTGPQCGGIQAETPPPPAYAAGYPIRDCEAFGSAIAQETSYARDPATNLNLSVTDALARETSWTYDSLGNVLSVTQLAGTSAAVTTNFTYAAPFSQVATITDPLGDETIFARNGLGEATSITDANGNATSFTYTAEGQVASVTDPLGDETSYGYGFGDLATVADPLGRTWSVYADTLGRPVAATDPLGATTATTYDPLYGIASLTDPNGDATGFTYDADGNLLSVTDPRNNVTGFSYDARDRLITRTDPLGNGARFAYDNDSNLVAVTDRKGQPSGYVYDALNRLAEAYYCTGGTSCASSSADLQASVAYTWDAGNRLTVIRDLPAGVTSGGTVARDYDLLDRLTSETTTPPGTTTALGTASYTYDAASRPATMTAGSAPTLAYSFDPGNRLTGISSGGTASVCIGYDAANRRTLLVLPDGGSASYGYDAASELTVLTDKPGGSLSPCTAGTGTALGTLAYTYDDAGRRASAAGVNLVKSVLPGAVTTATYNADNQLTKWVTGAGRINPTWDANGNLTNDGTSVYTWDARDRLLAVGSVASFAYDAAGRRLSLTAGGSTAYYLYDRLNPVAILGGSGGATTQLLTGLNLDERFAATTSGTTESYLVDALGSTVALAAPGGTSLSTTYAYAASGVTEASGAVSTNSFQFTGRENDPTGLYYLRARYYNPTWGRFISEDPIGLNGGINLYAYAGDSPLNLIDPTGLVGVGFIAGVSAEGGVPYYSAGAQDASGAGVFLNVSPDSANFGSSSAALFTATGGAVTYGNMGANTTSLPSTPAGRTNGALGAFAGAGAGVFITNANNPQEFSGISRAWTLNTPIVSIQFSLGANGVWALSGTLGPGIGVDFSSYSTMTVTSGGSASTSASSQNCQ